MLQYKYIHKDNGYKGVFNTEDEDIRYEVSSYIEVLKSVASKENEPLYIYVPTNKYPILYKEKDTLINSIFDNDNIIKELNCYSCDLLFDEMLLRVDNSEVLIQSNNIRTPQFMKPMHDQIEHKCLIYAFDLLLNNKKRIAIVGKDINKVKSFIKSLLHMLPQSFANNLGYVVNPKYIPNVHTDLINKINLFGCTIDQDFSDMDVVIDITNPNQDFNFTSIGRVLNLYINNPMKKDQVVKEITKYIDDSGNFNQEACEKYFAPMLFEVANTDDNAYKFIDCLYQDPNMLVESRLVNMLFDYILNKNLYNGSYQNKIYSIISKRSDLESFSVKFKEKIINNYIDNMKNLNQVQINEVVDYYCDSSVEITPPIKEKLLNKRNEPKFYDVLFELLFKVRDANKHAFFVDMFDVARTYDIIIEGKPYNTFISNKIFKYDEARKLKLVTYFLISCVSKKNSSKVFATNRIDEYFKTICNSLNGYEIIKHVVTVYKYLKETIKEVFIDNIQEYDEFKLFSIDQLKSLVRFNPRNVENDYINLMEFFITFECGDYSEVKNIIVQTLLSKDIKNEYYYQNFINSNRLDLFKRFLAVAEVDVNSDIEEFINSLQVETEVSTVLKVYRLDFIYNSYITNPISIRKKIAKKLSIKYDKTTDDKIKNIIYEDVNNDKNKKKLKKTTIDVILDSVKYDDSITNVGETGNVKNTSRLMLIDFFVSIFAFILFNIPVIVKSILLDKNIFDVFIEVNNFVTPFVFLYSFICFMVLYFINSSKTRGNEKQAYGRTFVSYTFLVIIPFIAYSALYLGIYFLF